MKIPPSFCARRHRQAGYSLVEILLVVAIISIVSSVGYFVVTNIRENSQNTKLMRDVATVNQAMRAYEMSGGNFHGLTQPQQVLDKMKKQLSGQAEKRMAGLRGTFVDKRLVARMQTAAEAQTSAQRAYYRADLRQFVVASSGGAGIREFGLDESLAMRDYGEDDRRSSYDLATNSRWVWNYTDGTLTPRRAPSGGPNPTPGVGPGGPAPTAAPLRLNPPDFSIPSGSYPLLDYPLSLILSNPNPRGVSVIIYTKGSGSWRTYEGAVAVNPGEKVEAMAISLDPDKWEDSNVDSRTYQTTPEQLNLELQFAKSAYNYVELGGAVQGGGAPPPPVNGKLTLTNANAIPPAYLSSDYFRPQWTYDGSDPITSSTAVHGGNFTGGFNGQDIPLRLSDYGSGTQATVRAAMKTENTSILTNSQILTRTLNIETIQLRIPRITVEERKVTISLDTAFGDMPVGARIFYTTDGSDPGNNAGNPVRGTEYRGAFELSGVAGSNIDISARVYAPVGYLNWFTPSRREVLTYRLPAATDFYVGGNFYLSSGTSSLRNIARLKGAGNVDSSFDVGSGASSNSLVGVVRQENSGRVFAGGDFETMNSQPRAGVVRLNPNGSVDLSYDAALSGK